MKLLALVLLLLALIFPSVSMAQFGGIVYDAETELPLQGAVINDGTNQTITDRNGRFKIPADHASYFIVSHLGYYTDTISGVSSEIYLVPDYTRLEQVVVKSPLMQNNLINLPVSISMLHNSDLQQTQSITFMDDLNRLPGIHVHNGTINTNRVTIRGMGSRTPYGSNRIKAYFNDIPLTSGDGTTSIEDIDPAMINTVEIVKGAKSALYGPGLGGIIILSGRKYFKQGLHGNAGIEAGSFGTLNPKLSLRYKKGKLATSLSYSFTGSNGWRQNSGFDKHSGNVYTSYHTKRNKTDVMLHFIQMKAYIPSSLNEETFINAPDSAAKNWLAVKGYEQYNRLLSGISNYFRISEKFVNTTVIYLNYYKGYESRPFNILADNAMQGGLKSTFDYIISKWSFRAGIELTSEKYNWEIYETDKGTHGILLNSFSELRTPVNLYTQAAFSFNNGGSVEAGLSYNFMNYQTSENSPDSLDQSGDYRYDPFLSPFIGINFPLGNKFRLYASIGNGFSYPSVEETLLPEGQVNPHIKPESGMNFELGTRLSAWNGKLFADVNAYLIFIRDLLITKRESEDMFYGINAGKTRHMGVEASASMRLNENTTSLLPETQIDLSFTLTDNRFTDFIDDNTDYSGNYLPGIPFTNFFSGISFSYPWGLYANLLFSYTGKQHLDDGNTGKYGSYKLVHVKTGYKLSGDKIVTNFYFGVQNLFNEHYASMLLVNAPSFGSTAPRYYYPGVPRSFYAGFSVSF